MHIPDVHLIQTDMKTVELLTQNEWGIWWNHMSWISEFFISRYDNVHDNPVLHIVSTNFGQE